jgi:hypothetical protein
LETKLPKNPEQNLKHTVTVQFGFNFVYFSRGYLAGNGKSWYRFPGVWTPHTA